MKTLANTPLPELVADVLALAEDAYYEPAYANWPSVAQALIVDGWSIKQAAAIMLSKWARWASDNSEYAYGDVRASDLIAFMASSTQNDFEKLSTEVNALVAETFTE